jgi:HD-like signal output (HDOD) protein
VSEEPTREQRIEACLKVIASQPEFPAFLHHIQAVTLLIEDESASLHRLTNMVLRDYSLTLRVLRVANSMCYNRSGRPVVSVAHSITLLGTETIRSLAGGAALFEYYRKISPGLKELMLLSLLTANQTRAVAAAVDYPRPEEAYLCGMFRNLGELLIAGYFPRQYAGILSQMKESNLGQREVCTRVLHFTFEELGQAMAKQWKLPDRVSQCMSAAGPLCLGADDAELATLKAATAFSHALTTAVYRRDPEGAAARVNLLVLDYSPALGLRHDQVSGVLETGIVETKSTFSELSVPLDELRLRRQAEAAVASVAAGEPFEEPARPAEEVARGEELLRQFTRDIESMIEASADFDLHRLMLMILEAAYRGGPFDRVLFCLTDPAHQVMQGRLGLGERIEELRDTFRVPISVRGGLIGATLVRRQDLFVAARNSYAEAEALESVGAVSLGVYPILAEGVLGGCLYFDRLSAKPAPSPRTLELLARLRDLAAKALLLRRPAAA